MSRNVLSALALAALFLPNASAVARSYEAVPGTIWFQHLLQWPLSIVFRSSLAPATIAVEEQFEVFSPTVPCLVEPLAEITDTEALEFESYRGSDSVVQTDGMTPAAFMALNQFQTLVQRFGGTIEVKSAYRPPAYQEHLQQVWDKWMVELKDNVEPECSELRTAVWEEFAGHALLESQRPASISDHSRGTAFDAAVFLPKFKSRAKQRKVNVDVLARRAGLHRPVAIQDPVHFRLGVPKRLVKTKSASRRAGSRRV